MNLLMKKVMKKNLNIMMDGKPLVLDAAAAIDVEEVNPLESNEPVYSSSAWL